MPNITDAPPETDEVEVEPVTCFDCGEEIDEDTDETVASHGYRNGEWGDQVAHAHHYFDCDGCGGTIHEDNEDSSAEDVDDGRYCNNCVQYCDDCDRYVVSMSEYDSRCRDCNSTEGLMGYGHTEPSTWLGGPLPKREDGSQIGYYLGIELEIVAESGDRRGYTKVREWLDENLGGRRNMDLKHDGSVDGYEMATQPMTPDYFENVNWESFFEMVNEAHPLSDRGYDDEPDAHGLHVHIGRTAFHRDDVAIAAFCYLIGQDNHLERIGRREATHYCEKVPKPVSSAIVHRKGTRTTQGMRLHYNGNHFGRTAINLLNSATIEIRAFKSTRSANEFRDAVRMVYVAAEYIRHLRVGRKPCGPQALRWDTFAEWVKTEYPFAYDSIVGNDPKGSNAR